MSRLLSAGSLLGVMLLNIDSGEAESNQESGTVRQADPAHRTVTRTLHPNPALPAGASPESIFSNLSIFSNITLWLQVPLQSLIDALAGQWKSENTL